MSVREQLKRLLAEDPKVINTLRQEVCLEREAAARKTKAQLVKETREREVIEQQRRMDAECDRPILELTGKCQNCKSAIKLGPEIKFCESPHNMRASAKCTNCGKINWIFLAKGWVETPLKITTTMNPAHEQIPYYENGVLVTK